MVFCKQHFKSREKNFHGFVKNDIENISHIIQDLYMYPIDFKVINIGSEIGLL